MRIALPFNGVFAIALLILLSGCVETRAVSQSVDKSKALENHIALGMAYLQRGSRESSRRHFEKALAIDSGSARALNGMGLLYQLNGEANLAESTFSQSLSNDPDYSQARLNYGAFLYQQKRYQEAYDAFDRASKDLSFERRALSLAYLGRAALRLDRSERAKSAFEHSLNIDNSILLSKIELAELYFAEEEYEKAKRFLDQYNSTTKSTPRSLWLGIRIERIFGNQDKEASYALALRNLHPYSKEYLEYKKLVN